MSVVKIVILSVALSFAAILPCTWLLISANAPKIGVVRAQDLVAKNAMFKEQMDSWQNHESSLKSNILTLEEEVTKQMSEFEKEKLDLDEETRTKRMRGLESKRKEYFSYVNSVQEKATVQHDEIVKSVLTRINQVMEQYGQDHGFDIILGSAGEGNILYGAMAIDITDDVLAEFNNEYYDEKQ